MIDFLKDNFFRKKNGGKNLQSKVGFEKTKTHFAARYLSECFGSVWFLWAFLTFVGAWFAITKSLPTDPLTIGIHIFDVCLTIILLISQSREVSIREVRQQIDLEINVRAEMEIKKILKMIEEVHEEMGIAKKDTELEQMKQTTNIEEIKEEIEQVIREEKKMQSHDFTPKP